MREACGVRRETEYNNTDGIEYRSACFSLTPLGVIHFWHVLEGALNILNRLEKERE